MDLPLNYLMCSLLHLFFVNSPACVPFQAGDSEGVANSQLQRSQAAASPETRHLPATPVLVNGLCLPWAGPSI